MNHDQYPNSNKFLNSQKHTKYPGYSHFKIKNFQNHWVVQNDRNFNKLKSDIV